jgi:hypothetical protein
VVESIGDLVAVERRSGGIAYQMTDAQERAAERRSRWPVFIEEDLRARLAVPVAKQIDA